MKIDWKSRLTHKPFLTALFAAVLLLIQQIALIFGVDTTLYNEQATEVFNTVLYILVILGIVVDPSTPGVKDKEVE